MGASHATVCAYCVIVHTYICCACVCNHETVAMACMYVYDRCVSVVYICMHTCHIILSLYRLQVFLLFKSVRSLTARVV